jgi:hypothetical protein
MPVPDEKVNPTFCDVVMFPIDALAELDPPFRSSVFLYWYVDGTGMLPESGGTRLMIPDVPALPSSA